MVRPGNKDQVKELAVKFVDGFAEKIFLQIPGIAAERPKSAGAFGTAQIAGRGWFYADRDGHSPLYRAARPF